MSRKLDQWFKVNQTNHNYQYFYMNWSHPDQPAIWLSKRPILVSFEKEIWWPDLKTKITICGYEPDDQYQSNFKNKFENVSLLKSHLQKAIRRQASEIAVKTAYHLWHLDSIALLKRLTISVLEDTLLHQSYLTLVWLLMAQPELKWSLKMLQFVLQTVEFYCQVKYFDNIPPPENSRFVFTQNLTKIENTITDPIDRGLLYAIWLRQSLSIKSADSDSEEAIKETRKAKITGDQRLLIDKTHLWFLRFSKNYHKYIKLVHKPLVVDLKRPLPEKLQLNQFILAAVDHHCAPMMIDWIKQKVDLSTKEIKQAIWYKRSSINTRTYLADKEIIEPEIVKNWRSIEWHVEQMSLYIVKHYH